uniref:Uncharacterized protein n=1 Tax=Anguilla anguilla TaxID=7936 RepID=A0A0E9RH10_ANGAN
MYDGQLSIIRCPAGKLRCPVSMSNLQ